MAATTQQSRLAAVLNRIAVGTNVIRTRGADAQRDHRNGKLRDEGLEKAVAKLEAAADALWESIR